MADPERFLIEAVELFRRLASEGDRLARRRWRRRRVRRLLRGILLLVIANLVLVPALIGGGFWLGRHWFFALIAAPIVLISSWSAILYWAFGRPRHQSALPLTSGDAGRLKAADLAQLPAQTSDWIEQERAQLPWAAQARLDAIGQRLESLGPQLRGKDAQADGATELRRLLGEELPELVRGYRKLPLALTQQPLYGGSTPEQQLVAGLETVDKQLVRLHERLAQNDLHALATHKRYLELKYGRDDEDEPRN
jgi:hypothetical protein